MCLSDAALQHSVTNRVGGKSPSKQAARSSRSGTRCAFRDDVRESGEMWILSSGEKKPCFQEMQCAEFPRSLHRNFAISLSWVESSTVAEPLRRVCSCCPLNRFSPRIPRCAFREDVRESGEMWILSSGEKKPCFPEMQYSEIARSLHSNFAI